MNNDLASRSINSVKWNSISNIFQLVLGVIQTIILARLLPIETFGVYAGAAAIVVITSSLSQFGMAAAFMHRCEETDDLQKTAAVHFTLQTIFSFGWLAVMLVIGFIFLRSQKDSTLTAFLIIIVSQAIYNLTMTPRFIFARGVQFKRLSIITIIDTITTFIAAITLALLKKPLLALTVTQISNAVVHVVLLYFWKPIWLPRFGWDPKIVRYFLRFGGQQVVARFLMDALDRFDELWVRFYLGSVPLGFYSKAYSFAQYPSKIVAAPITSVSNATYSEIAADRKRLSEAFYRTNSLMIYSGMFIVGAFMLIAGEFIRVVLGERWMPMLLALQIMLPYAMFEPIKQTMANVFLAVGNPGIIVKIRGVQLAVMILCLFIFGNLYGVEGVAVAVDIMMVIGITLILLSVREYVDYSIKELFLVPGMAVLFGLLAGAGVDRFLLRSFSDIPAALIKGILFSLVYIGLIYIFNKKELIDLIKLLRKHLF